MPDLAKLLRHRGLRLRAKLLAVLSACGLLLPLVAGLGASLPPTAAWLLDLAVHWQWLFLAGLLVALSLLVLGERRWALAALLVPLPWMAGMPGAPVQTGAGPALVVAGANMHLDNLDARPLADWVSRTRPDVLVVLEASDAYVQKWGLEAWFPHRIVVPRPDPFGIALLSRHPIKRHTVVDSTEATPRIEAVIDWQGTELTLVAFHPMPPISVVDHAQRNRSLGELTSRLSEVPTVIVGDFNATPWSSAFAAPQRNGFVRASGLSPTWPAAWAGLMGLPIDQVIVSRHWAVSDHAVGPDIGSDHLPVIVTLTRRAD